MRQGHFLNSTCDKGINKPQRHATLAFLKIDTRHGAPLVKGSQSITVICGLKPAPESGPCLRIPVNYRRITAVVSQNRQLVGSGMAAFSLFLSASGAGDVFGDGVSVCTCTWGMMLCLMEEF